MKSPELGIEKPKENFLFFSVPDSMGEYEIMNLKVNNSQHGWNKTITLKWQLAGRRPLWQSYGDAMI